MEISLNPVERWVFGERSRGRTHEEIASHLGLSVARVRQVERAAKEKLGMTGAPPTLAEIVRRLESLESTSTGHGERITSLEDRLESIDTEQLEDGTILDGLARRMNALESRRRETEDDPLADSEEDAGIDDEEQEPGPAPVVPLLGCPMCRVADFDATHDPGMVRCQWCEALWTMAELVSVGTAKPEPTKPDPPSPDARALAERIVAAIRGGDSRDREALWRLSEEIRRRSGAPAPAHHLARVEWVASRLVEFAIAIRAREGAATTADDDAPPPPRRTVRVPAAGERVRHPEFEETMTAEYITVHETGVRITAFRDYGGLASDRHDRFAHAGPEPHRFIEITLPEEPDPGPQCTAGGVVLPTDDGGRLPAGWIPHPAGAGWSRHQSGAQVAPDGDVWHAFGPDTNVIRDANGDWARFPSRDAAMRAAEESAGEAKS